MLGPWAPAKGRALSDKQKKAWPFAANEFWRQKNENRLAESVARGSEICNQYSTTGRKKQGEMQPFAATGAAGAGTRGFVWRVLVRGMARAVCRVCWAGRYGAWGRQCAQRCGSGVIAGPDQPDHTCLVILLTRPTTCRRRISGPSNRLVWYSGLMDCSSIQSWP